MIEVPTPIVNVPTPVVNVDVPNIKVPPAIVKVPKKLILRKEVKVNSEMNEGYGSDTADSGKVHFEEAVDHEYKSSSNKNQGQQTTVTYDGDDDEYDYQQPAMKLPPRTPNSQTKDTEVTTLSCPSGQYATLRVSNSSNESTVSFSVFFTFSSLLKPRDSL